MLVSGASELPPTMSRAGLCDSAGERLRKSWTKMQEGVSSDRAYIYVTCHISNPLLGLALNNNPGAISASLHWRGIHVDPEIQQPEVVQACQPDPAIRGTETDGAPAEGQSCHTCSSASIRLPGVHDRNSAYDAGPKQWCGRQALADLFRCPPCMACTMLEHRYRYFFFTNLWGHRHVSAHMGLLVKDCTFPPS